MVRASRASSMGAVFGEKAVKAGAGRYWTLELGDSAGKGSRASQ